MIACNQRVDRAIIKRMATMQVANQISMPVQLPCGCDVLITAVWDDALNMWCCGKFIQPSLAAVMAAVAIAFIHHVGTCE